MHYPKAVWHPGTKARLWAQTLESHRLHPFRVAVEGAVALAASKMWKK
jgi:hypothetical protein